MDFGPFFTRVTGHGAGPFRYQCRLACGEPEGHFDSIPVQSSKDEMEWLRGGTRCRSAMITVPTGLGKTAGVIVAWLWNRLRSQDPGSGSRTRQWPRRLVYCLPMRTLVEQTEASVRLWLDNLWRRRVELELSDSAIAEVLWLAGDGTCAHPAHSPVVLIGGEDLDSNKRDWDIYPEKPCILIGTQDMLLSRALNRGYGMSRYRWPIHFGLLNNDCLWVLDETQLMGPALGTARQLEAFRKAPPAGFGSFTADGSATWYMSATHNPDQLQTREWRDADRPEHFAFGLSRTETVATADRIHARLGALKQLELNPDSHFADSNAAQSLVERVLQRHSEMLARIGGDPKLPARTLIICNTVDRAVAVHARLESQKPEGCDLVLLHSRFRPPERRERMRRLTGFKPTEFPKGQIIVSTQVVEAGLDVSSGVLWSEIAPLASLVQRLGRLNRAGEFNGPKWLPQAVIVGVGVEPAPTRETKEQKEKREKENTKRCLPYELQACTSAWESLKKLKGNASPLRLDLIKAAITASIPPRTYSLQRHELLDFFDTDANLSLGFTDVSPFVRGLDADTDIYVLWRGAWPQREGGEGTREPAFTPDYQRDELCPVSIGKAREARDLLNQGWLWRGKDSGWISVRDADLAPGMTILLPCAAGGYDPQKGWTGKNDDKNVPSCYEPENEPPDEDLLSCLENGWQNIEQHANEVKAELQRILTTLDGAGFGQDECRALQDGAVPWHDVGKNHPAWQKAVADALEWAGIQGMDAHRPFAKFSLSESPRLRNADGSLKFTSKDLKREIQRLRRLFRPAPAHEVVSALAFRQTNQERLGPARDSDLASLLAEYVIMSHHGRVRKVLRDEIPRFPKDAKDTETVRGVRNGDALPDVMIDGRRLGCASLSTECRKMGRSRDGHESYTRGVLRLMDHYGPLRLAFFEAVFRAADMRASARIRP